MNTLAFLAVLGLMIFLLPYALFRLLLAYLQKRGLRFRQQEEQQERQSQKQQHAQYQYNNPTHRKKIFEKNNSEYVDFEEIKD